VHLQILLLLDMNEISIKACGTTPKVQARDNKETLKGM